MLGRLPAVALVATGLAGVAVVGASACGGDSFTVASADASIANPAEAGRDGSSTGEGSVPGDDGGGDAAAPPDGGAEDAGDADVTDGPSTSDAIALPDVVDEAPAHCVAGEFECIPAIPPGWQGPFEVYRGPTPPVLCTPNFFPSYQGGEGVDGGPATCGCTCSTATGVQCSAVTAAFYVSTAGLSGCTSLGHCTSVSLPTGMCASDINASSQCSSLLGSTLFTLSGSTADGGSCEPVPTTSVPDAGWSLTTRACVSMVALGQADCPSGSLCAPKPAQPYSDTTLCIAQAGDVPCPGTDYINRSVSFSGVNDGRRCAGCNCGPVTGSSCSGYVDVTPTPSAGGTSCTGNYTRYIVPQSCTPGVQQPGDLRATLTPQPGSCTPTVPAPAGTVAGASPTTFCCQ